MSTTPDSPPRRGWYDDPTTPGRYCWWDGAAWTVFTHRRPIGTRALFGVGYAQAWWAGPNRAAGRSLLIARIAVLFYILSFVVIGFIAAGHEQAAAVAIGILVASGATLGAGVVALVYGIIGVRRAPALGPILPAVWGTGVAALCILLSGGFLTLALLGAFHLL